MSGNTTCRYLWIGAAITAVLGSSLAPAAAQSMGALTIAARIAGVEISINGEPVGKTGPSGDLTITKLPAGPVKVQAVKDGYLEWQQEATVAPNAESKVLVLLRPSVRRNVTVPAGIVDTMKRESAQHAEEVKQLQKKAERARKAVRQPGLPGKADPGPAIQPTGQPGQPGLPAPNTLAPKIVAPPPAIAPPSGTGTLVPSSGIIPPLPPKP